MYIEKTQQLSWEWQPVPPYCEYLQQEAANCGVERNQGRVFVSENTEKSILYTHGDTCGNRLLEWYEPIILLGALICIPYQQNWVYH